MAEDDGSRLTHLFGALEDWLDDSLGDGFLLL